MAQHKSLPREVLISSLHDIEAVRFGDIELKSGIISPIYIDLRILISHPRILMMVADSLIDILSTLEFQRVAAIPYTALPIGTAVSLKANWPMIYLRREGKQHGIQRNIEGDFSPGEVVAVIDDVITTGKSKLETIAPLEAAGLTIRDIVVVVDRGQGSAEEVTSMGYRLHSVLHLDTVLDVLRSQERIDETTYLRCRAFLSE